MFQKFFKWLFQKITSRISPGIVQKISLKKFTRGPGRTFQKLLQVFFGNYSSDSSTQHSKDFSNDDFRNSMNSKHSLTNSSNDVLMIFLRMIWKFSFQKLVRFSFNDFCNILLKNYSKKTSGILPEHPVDFFYWVLTYASFYKNFLLFTGIPLTNLGFFSKFKECFQEFPREILWRYLQIFFSKGSKDWICL